MSNLKKTNSSVIALITFIALTFNFSQAQTFNLSNQESTLKVLGTSSLHDWHITAENQGGKISFKNLDEGLLETCSLVVTSESLKSGKSAMDKNTYKSLKTNEHKNITFQLAEVKEVTSKGNGKFYVKTLGDLTIVGVKKRISLDFNMDTAGGRVSLTGEKNIKMTDFKIDPPKALLGTITTGDAITIKFSTIYK